MEDSSSRKRPRPVVSCLRCRDKKLKCDRTTPCENCVKAQTATTCTYSRNGLLPAKDVSPVANGLTSRNVTLEDLAARMAKVEELLGVARSSTKEQSPAPQQPLLGTVVVKGNRSVYHGQNDRVTLLNQFLDVKDFLGDMSKDEKIQASAKQIKFLQEKSRAKIASPDSIHESDYSPTLLKLREFMPPKVYCDRLIDIYCQQFERTMRVLHIPSFRRQYDQIWANTNPEICTSSFIIPQVTVVMTMAYHMDDASNFGEDQTHRTYLKGAAIDLVQAWLDELGRKQRTELSTLQVEILVLTSKSLRALSPEKAWSSTGALVRSGMVMGLNTDPTTVPDLPPFQIEMRRRLWATVLEMDLQASMTAGMPLVVPELDPTSLVPSNLNDSDFDESSASLPASRSLNTYTDNLYQVILTSSLPERLKALLLVQRSAPNVQEAISLGRKIDECISCKPQVMSLHNNSGAPHDGGSLLHRVLLDLYLRRPLLCLYKPLLLGQQLDSTIHAEIQRHCLASSQAILSYQELYTIPALAAVTHSPWAHQNFFYRCCKMDVLWAALTLCQHVKLLRHAPAAVTGRNDALLIKTVENTIDCLTERIGQKGSDLKDIVFLSLALQSVQLPDSMPGRSHALQQTVRKTLAACRERLLQPMFTSEQPQVTLSAKRAKTSATSTPTSLPYTTTQAIADLRLTPTPLSDMACPIDLPENAEQWFGDLPDLAAEFDTFQADMYNPNDAFNFGITQNWNWEHMWQ